MRVALSRRSGALSALRLETSRHGCQHLLCRTARRPRRSQPVAEPSWNDMKVEVEHVLPTGRSVRLGENQSVRAESLFAQVGNLFRTTLFVLPHSVGGAL